MPVAFLEFTVVRGAQVRPLYSRYSGARTDIKHYHRSLIDPAPIVLLFFEAERERYRTMYRNDCYIWIPKYHETILSLPLNGAASVLFVE